MMMMNAANCSQKGGYNGGHGGKKCIHRILLLACLGSGKRQSCGCNVGWLIVLPGQMQCSIFLLLIMILSGNWFSNM